MSRARILHRIMLGNVFCKTGSLSPEQAFYVWQALKGDLLDIPMLVWCEMYDAYSAPVKNSLPFGSLIIGLPSKE
ncbi:hypothetical protein FRX31_033949 [Thalictrum thalictroides]|uniref:Uncharacterized protein n=1 Tax=Thalictrum thalictroides TaxID=46969 RepID=A0A7J6UV37_THATH|nr:hypothetical protein FRX31_033949 [Thalictrum thalictroides]